MNPIIGIAHRPETPKPDPPIPNEPDNGEGDGQRLPSGMMQIEYEY
ncbi:hypothetical protein FVEG_05002 [Fusarium verticillioides 7600]|uniref:Uncharacterized protein n=1 Tax=Gibberella moniliformis (strain M3125 / FGSC 7600) TaxID=334819 RepID=W7M815_GIBM7|nr:hypothetical protein FVEG_05002 [Fusarium verticillioides 7600]EWG43594.1 hypothetical protein FVEG_05002 [Fusarium verticillioides 7600]